MSGVLILVCFWFSVLSRIRFAGRDFCVGVKRVKGVLDQFSAVFQCVNERHFFPVSYMFSSWEPLVSDKNVQ